MRACDGLPPLPSKGAPADDATVADFAEQFAVDESAVTDARRRAFGKALGPKMFTVTENRRRCPAQTC